MKLFESSGILHYSGEDRLVLEIEKDFGRYYRSLIPKWVGANGLRYAPHVTIVRTGKEVPAIKEHWGKYQGEIVSFFYDPIIQNGEVYFWLNVFCKRFEQIRKELGLPVESIYTLPPEGFQKCFHTTIARRNIVG